MRQHPNNAINQKTSRGQFTLSTRDRSLPPWKQYTFKKWLSRLAIDTKYSKWEKSIKMTK